MGSNFLAGLAGREVEAVSAERGWGRGVQAGGDKEAETGVTRLSLLCAPGNHSDGVAHGHGAYENNIGQRSARHRARFRAVACSALGGGGRAARGGRCEECVRPLYNAGLPSPLMPASHHR
jgi:hypothetical protein